MIRLGLRFALAIAAFAPAFAGAFGFEDVDRVASELAARPYAAPRADLPAQLRDLDYDQYRDIRFRNDHALWRTEGLPFEVAFFHRGRQFDAPVRIHEVVAGAVRTLPFRGEDFDYGANTIDRERLPRDLGFAGLRVHFNVNSPDYKDEVLVFLGASYLRALGQGQRYGLSARGLAVDTALASGEEFPRFTDFWLERPAAGARELVIHALMDSPGVSGAYRFVLRPGSETALDVKARLHPRRAIARLGIAPLTSMFLFGENQRAATEDYRPEVHDSDGLSIHAGSGEWIWRPLVNPRTVLTTSFSLDDTRGFGLQQRDRAFASYEDLEARYELRPSAWVQPSRPFGPGRVDLVLIPTPDETHDNVVAYWVPRETPTPGRALDFEYRLLWQKDAPTLPPSSWVAQTRRGPGWLRRPEDNVQLHVDFEGPALRKLGDAAKVEAVFSADANGELVERIVQRNPATSGVRVSVKVRRRDPARPVELRGFLREGNETLSETWAYLLPPD